MRKFSHTTRSGSVSSIGSITSDIVKNSKESTSRHRTWRLIFAAVLPVIGLIIQNTVLVSQEVGRIASNTALEKTIDFGLNLGNILHFCQLERGTTILFLNSENKDNAYAVLAAKHSDTDTAFLTLFTHTFSGQLGEKIKILDSFYTDVKSYRNRVWGGEESDGTAIAFYSQKISEISYLFGEIVENLDDGAIWRIVIAYYSLTYSKEHWGIVRGVGASILARGQVPIEEFSTFCFSYATGNSVLKNSMQFNEQVSNLIDTQYTGTPTEKTINSFLDTIFENNSTRSASNVQHWFGNMTSYVDILYSIEQKLRGEILTKLQNQVTSGKRLLAVSILMVIVSILLLPTVAFLVIRMTSTIRGYASGLKEKGKDLSRERKKTQNLLHEILPISIAEKLVRKEVVPPEHFTAATIYFSDIVGFTDISSNSTPIQVVDMLNLIYKTFDRRLELFDVYKVETIGDAYMVASGLPERNGLFHSAELALLSLDLMDSVGSITIPHLPDEKLQLKVGLNTGPVVGGVVGLKMPRYCLFGDTVNTASRMESTGLPNKIHMSQRTQRSLAEDHGGFVIEKRGEIEIKGKGKMTTYFLVGKDDILYPDR